MITNAAASAAILAHCDAGTIVQNQWHGRASDGRAVACLLGAIDPSVETPADCNAELMPMWLAELTPALFDGLPADAVYPIARRYGSLVGRWHQLSDAQWHNIFISLLRNVIDYAVDVARPLNENQPYWPQVAAACEQSITAIIMNRNTDIAAKAANKVAKATVEAIEAVRDVKADSTAYVAEAAARTATWAARAVVANTRPAARAGEAVAWAAEAAAWAAEAVAEAANWAVPKAAAYKQIFIFLLDRIEQALHDRQNHS